MPFHTKTETERKLQEYLRVRSQLMSDQAVRGGMRRRGSQPQPGAWATVETAPPPAPPPFVRRPAPTPMARPRARQMTQRYQISPQLRRPVVEVTPSPLATQKFVGPEDDARQGYYDNRMHTPEELARGKKRIEDNLPPFNHVPFGQFRRTGEVLPAKQGAVGPPLPPLGVLTVPVGPTARPTRIPDKETKAMLEGLVTAEEYQKRKGYPVGATPPR